MTKLATDSPALNLRSLDALRGLLATYVLLGHCRWLLWTGNNQWNQYSHPWWAEILASASAFLRYGHEAVIVFFVLSGFFIHLRASKQLATSQNFKFDVLKFFKRRCHRLIPPYIFALILTLIVDLIGRYLFPTLYNGLTGDSLIDTNFIRKDFSLTSVIPALFMLPRSLGKDFGSNGPLWSLSYEVIYYIIYPLWLIIRSFGALPAYFIGLGLAIFANVFLEPGFVHSVLIHYPIWMSGAVISEILVKKTLPKWMNLTSLLLLGIAFIAINFNLSLPIEIIFYTILGSSVVLFTINLPFSLVTNKLHQLFEFIGIESYTIYICHFPIITFISAWYIELFKSRPMHGWLAIGGFIFTLLFTHICFQICERHFLHSRLRITEK